MRPVQPRNFYGTDLAAPLTGEVAPPAACALVVQADGWPLAVALAPYAGCAHIFDGCTQTGLEARYLAAVIAPAAVHGRAALTRCWGPLIAGATPYHELWSTDGGVTGNDVVRVAWYQNPFWGTVQPTFQGGTSEIAVSGAAIIDGPTEPVDRQLELQTLGAPYVEPLYVSIAAGYSLCITDQIADLENL